MSDFHFFYTGVLSQWYTCDFTIDDIEYNCAEQYMMAEKARLFGDEQSLEDIMNTDDPYVQKSIGRVVSDFEEETWEAMHPWSDNDEKPYCWQVVWKGNYAKFTQNKNLQKTLLATGNKLIVEASTSDCIWGIGLDELDPRARDKSTWRGSNWLGEVLTDLRDAIRSKGAYPGSI